MVSAALLRRWYREHNRRYFDGNLPKDALVYFYPLVGCYGDCSRDESGRFHIRLNSGYMNRHFLMRLTLIHEMVHVRLWPRRTHGAYFDKEMLRLAIAGALKGLL